MKKFNLLLAITALFFAGTAFAQDTQNKWLIGVGAHATDHTSVRAVFGGFFDTDDYSVVPPLSKLSISRSLNRSFAVDLEASIGEIDNKRLKIEDEFFILAGIGLRFKIMGALGKEGHWFDPYLRVGANYHKFAYDGLNISASNPHVSYDNDYTEGGNTTGPNSSLLQQDFEGQDNNFIVNGGAGINFWLTKNFGLNVESQYNWAPAYEQDYINFFQHSVSAVFKFGAPKAEPVIEKKPCDDFGGDTDGDTVCDVNDKCPTEFGLVELEGCPKVDPCANKGGDTDGDGICDADDKCPNDAKNDSDGDGICNNVDSCPDEFGVKEKNGCPYKGTIEILKRLLFDTNKSTIKPGQEVLLSNAVNYLKESKNSGNYYVDGHTDSDGTDKANLKLSQARANTVVAELVSRGISADRLTARGYGESSPSAECLTNAKDCKQLNRRVVFYEKGDSSAPADFIMPVVEKVKKVYKKGKKAVKKAFKKKK